LAESLGSAQQQEPRLIASLYGINVAKVLADRPLSMTSYP